MKTLKYIQLKLYIFRGLRQNVLTRPVIIDVFIYELRPLVKFFSKSNYFNNIKDIQFKLHIDVHWHLSFPTIKTHNSCCIHGLCPLVNVFQSLMIDFKLIWQNCSPWWDSHLSMCIFLEADFPKTVGPTDMSGKFWFGPAINKLEPDRLSDRCTCILIYFI